jgi:hypothetical protein
MVQAYANNYNQSSESLVMGMKYQSMEIGPYVRVADAVRTITDEYNARQTDLTLTPHQVQAIIWTDWGPKP